MLRNQLFEKGPHFTEIQRLTLPVSVFFTDSPLEQQDLLALKCSDKLEWKTTYVLQSYFVSYRFSPCTTSSVRKRRDRGLQKFHGQYFRHCVTCDFLHCIHGGIKRRTDTPAQIQTHYGRSRTDLDSYRFSLFIKWR